MRIYSPEEDKAYSKLDIIIPENDINDIIDLLKELKENPAITHLDLMDFNENHDKIECQLYFSIYTGDNISKFDERSREVILNDE